MVDSFRVVLTRTIVVEAETAEQAIHVALERAGSVLLTVKANPVGVKNEWDIMPGTGFDKPRRSKVIHQAT